jgi:hypothetical protein
MANIPGSPKTGGRKKATPNKKTQDLIDILESKGYSPAAELIRIAAIAEKEYDRSAEIFDAIQDARIAKKLIPLSESTAPTYLKIMQSSASDMMNYVYPKRKAVELTGEGGKDLFTSFTDLMKDLVDKE